MSEDARSPLTATRATDCKVTGTQVTDTIAALTETIDELTARVETLETEVEALDAENDRLRDRLDDHDDRLIAHNDQLTVHDDRLSDHDNQLSNHDDHLNEHADRLTTQTQTTAELDTRTEAIARKTDAIARKTAANKTRIEERQSRELEKGAHLRTDTVDPTTIEVPGDRLETLTKDDGHAYYRLPEQADPLDRSRPHRTTLTYGDLLPIQQLARIDEDMLRSSASALPTRLAAKVWKARTDETIGDNPWKRGSASVCEYVKASDLKHWIRRQERGVRDTYAKKLVSRTIDALLDLTKNRIAIRRKTERKNGLSYTERRVILPSDAEIPGETGRSQATTGDRSKANTGTETRDRSSRGATDRSEDATRSAPETPGVHG
ncbi:hypothetical protein [Halalkalirubrum salinum]|uniref:hypothetical protein n=1 Tax=Halalkalirubrum salinum TaxID=2563889 RepID=UPI00197B03F1|nr:hypothetical protein [Halalkalirubrum salinum]